MSFAPLNPSYHLRRRGCDFDLDQGDSPANDASSLRSRGEAEMPQGELIYLAGAVIAFVAFAIVVFWADRQTSNLPQQ
jgi:hypothetical protein